MRETRPDTSNEAVGERLVAIRLARDWTQTVFAAQLDVSYQRLGQWERGLRALPHEMVGRIWQLTGATADYIVLGRMDGLPFELAQALRKAEKAARGASG